MGMLRLCCQTHGWLCSRSPVFFWRLLGENRVRVPVRESPGVPSSPDHAATCGKGKGKGKENRKGKGKGKGKKKGKEKGKGKGMEKEK